MHINHVWTLDPDEKKRIIICTVLLQLKFLIIFFPFQMFFMVCASFSLNIRLGHTPRIPVSFFFNLHTFAFINYSIITIVHQKNKKKDKKRKEITNMPKINQYEMLTTLNTAHCHNVIRICVLCHVMSL